jgi:hypothetical protein
MLTSAEFKKALESLENGNELMEFHTAAVDKEKQTGIDKYRQKDSEVKKLKVFKSAIKKLGWDEESDVEDFSNTLQDTIEGKQNQENTELGKVQSQLKKLMRDFEKTQKELSVERENASKLQQQNKLKSIENTLTPKLSETFYNAGFMIKGLIADGKADLDESGNVVLKNGDEVMDLDSGINWLKDTHADAVKNTQRSGSSSTSSSTGSGAKYSKQQLQAMSAEDAAKDLEAFEESYYAQASG